MEKNFPWTMLRRSRSVGNFSPLRGYFSASLFESGYANISRRSLIRSTRTWASSYCTCCVSQLSALPPKTLDNRTAISGEIPRFPFTSSDRVVRVTPSAAAASVMVRPRGSMHWRSTRPPGCGGFFIGMVQSLSVVIDVINGDGITVCKPEDHPPVRPNRNRPKAFQLSLERMQPEPRQVHIRSSPPWHRVGKKNGDRHCLVPSGAQG